jgi:spore coat polysaccharide biosynthesis protein SpsF
LGFHLHDVLLEENEDRDLVSMRTAAVVLARLDSTRFPGKALMPLVGMPIIEHVLRRLQRCHGIDSVILATTGRDVDTPLADFFHSAGGLVYRGAVDEVHNVAKRFVSAARSVDADYALRVNGDSPFPDPWLIHQGMTLIDGEVDLVTNLLARTYPYGVSAELIRVDCLTKELPRLTEKEQEHLTSCFYRQPERFRIMSLQDCPWPNCKTRLTVDEPGDLDLLSKTLGMLSVLPVEADIAAIISSANAL